MRRTLTTVIAVAVPVLLACTSGPGVTADTSARPTTPSQQQLGGVPNLNNVRIGWNRVARGFAAPTQVTSARDGKSRLFVVEKGGRVKMVAKRPHPEPEVHQPIEDRLQPPEKAACCRSHSARASAPTSCFSLPMRAETGAISSSLGCEQPMRARRRSATEHYDG